MSHEYIFRNHLMTTIAILKIIIIIIIIIIVWKSTKLFSFRTDFENNTRGAIVRISKDSSMSA